MFCGISQDGDGEIPSVAGVRLAGFRDAPFI